MSVAQCPKLEKSRKKLAGGDVNPQSSFSRFNVKKAKKKKKTKKTKTKTKKVVKVALPTLKTKYFFVFPVFNTSCYSSDGRAGDCRGTP